MGFGFGIIAEIVIGLADRLPDGGLDLGLTPEEGPRSAAARSRALRSVTRLASGCCWVTPARAAYRSGIY